MKPLTLGAVAIGVAMLGGVWLFMSNQKPDASQALSQTNQPNPALTHSANQFAFNLFKELLDPQAQKAQRAPTVVHEQSPNFVLSPLGVQFVLTLLLNGAEGQTYQEIAHALGFQNASLNEINQYHLNIQQALRRWQAESKLVLANSIWISPSDRLHPDFARVGSTSYALEVYKVDFANSVEAVRRINEWGKRKTQGFIPEVLTPSEVDAETILAVLNALYLQAQWRQPFEVADYEMDFNPEAGKPIRFRPMEADLEDALYAQTDLGQIVGVPYRGADWLCYVVLPREGLRVREVIEQLDAERWREWLAQMKPQKVHLVMPRFELRKEYDLVPALQRLGIQRAFNPKTAEFPRILANQGGGYIELFKQVARIRVDERGTEAGAVTVATMELSEVVVVNRPFLFVVADRSSGVILFLGVVYQPEG